MKFMGFSKGSWLARLALLTLVGLLIASLGILSWPAKGRVWAHDDDDDDDDGRRTKLVWSVKFVCHLNLLGESIEGGPLYTGNTVINVHNPTEKSVKLNKKVVYAIRESARSGLGELEGRNIGLKHGEVLIPNDAFFVDCAEIANVLFPFLEMEMGDGSLEDIFGEGFFLDIFFPFPFDGPNPIYFDGFLVIEAKGTKHRLPLVVNAHHWLIGLIAGTSRQIVQVEPVEVHDKFELCEEEEPEPGCFSPPEP